MSSWPKLLSHAEPEDHIVQLYGEDHRSLTRNVSLYLLEGLRRLDGLVVIATPDHTEAIRRHLAEEAAGLTRDAEREGRLLFLDARTTLDQFLVDGNPDQVKFESVVGTPLRVVRERSGSGKVRAFGEMVSLLWNEERYDAAALLESHWNVMLARSATCLYCAYGINLFSDQVTKAGLNCIVGAHTHLLAGARTVLSSHRATA